MMVGHFLRFHQMHADLILPHVEREPWYMSSRFDDAWLTEGAHDDTEADPVDADLVAEYPSLAQIMSTLGEVENG
jgi:hypothetical protein